MLYNVYDKQNNLVFIGNKKEIRGFIGCNPRTLDEAIRECSAVNREYYVIKRDDMREYERHRGNKKGYQRC